MISQIPLSLLRHVHDPGTNGMGGPELDQQVVEVLPFLINGFRNCFVVQVDANTSKAFGYDGSERRGDPSDTRLCQRKLHILEFRSL